MSTDPAKVQADQVEQSSTGTTAPSHDADVGGQTYTRSFHKSFLVHFGNNMGYKGFELGARDAVSTLDEGYHLIPYWCPYASITMAEWNSAIRDACAVRCTGIGFQIDELQISRIETASESGTTKLTSTIAPEGKIHMIVDEEHWMEEFMANIDDTQIYEHSNEFQTPVMIKNPTGAVLPRCKIQFPKSYTNALLDTMGAPTDAFQGPSLYLDQGVKRLNVHDPIKYHFSGSEPWRPTTMQVPEDSDYWWGAGLPSLNQSSESLVFPVVDRPLDDGTLGKESNRIGYHKSNMATGVNVRCMNKPHEVLIKVEPTQDLSIGSIAMNARCWITYTSSFEFRKRKTRMWQGDTTIRPIPAASILGKWYRQEQLPGVALTDISHLHLQYLQRYQLRHNPATKGVLLYGPSGQVPSTTRSANIQGNGNT